MTWLNLGCGNTILENAVNHDRFKFAPHVDVAHDLDVLPWPWKDNSFEYIVAVDVLEHLDSFIAFFDECWRILQPGGEIAVRVPRYDCINVHIDPTHKRGYHPDSFDYLDPTTRWGSQYGMYTPHKWRKVELTDGDNITVVLRVVKEDNL